MGLTRILGFRKCLTFKVVLMTNKKADICWLYSPLQQCLVESSSPATPAASLPGYISFSFAHLDPDISLPILLGQIAQTLSDWMRTVGENQFSNLATDPSSGLWLGHSNTFRSLVLNHSIFLGLWGCNYQLPSTRFYRNGNKNINMPVVVTQLRGEKTNSLTSNICLCYTVGGQLQVN